MAILNYINIQDAVSIADDNGVFYVQVENEEPRLVTTEEILDAYKRQKIDQLKADCTNAIQAGFVSTALGEAHTYDSSLPQDQTNLLGARISGIDMFFTCTDSNGYKSQKWHTAPQMAQVYTAGMVHLQTQKARFYERKIAVEQAETIEAVEAVVW